MRYQFNQTIIDTAKFELSASGKVQSCEPKVFSLIVFLIEHRKRVVTREELFESIWEGREVSDTSLSNHIKIARKLLGDDGKSQKVIKTVHGRGYQFIEAIAQETESHFEESNLNLLARKIKPSFIFVTLFTLTGLGYFLTQQNVTPENDNYLMAVLPFSNNQPDDSTDYLGLALADRVISELAYVENINVRPTSAIRKYTKANFDLKQIGQNLKVDYLITGSYLSAYNKVQMNVEIVEIASNKMVWRSQQIEVENKSVFELQDRIAGEIYRGLNRKMGVKKKLQFGIDTPNNQKAYELYLRSIAQPFSTNGHRKAVSLLKRSVALDGNFAPSLVQLGNRIRRLEQFGLINTGESHQTLSYYQEALQIEPNLLSALSHLAFVYTESNRIDEAMRIVITMLEINPTNAQTHFTLGYIFRYAGLNEHAIREMEYAVKLDPRNVRFRSLIATYSGIKRFKDARKLLDYYPESAFTTGWQALLDIRDDNRESAIKRFNKLIVSDRASLWGLVATVHKAYLENEFEKGLIAVHQLEQTNIADAETVFYVAIYYCMLGETKRCQQSYRKAVDNGYYNYQFVDNSPYMDNVKNDPGFIASYNKAKQNSQLFAERFLPLTQKFQ